MQWELNYKAIRMGEQLESKWNAIGKHKKRYLESDGNVFGMECNGNEIESN